MVEKERRRCQLMVYENNARGFSDTKEAAKNRESHGEILCVLDAEMPMMMCTV